MNKDNPSGSLVIETIDKDLVDQTVSVPTKLVAEFKSYLFKKVFIHRVAVENKIDESTPPRSAITVRILKNQSYIFKMGCRSFAEDHKLDFHDKKRIGLRPFKEK